MRGMRSLEWFKRGVLVGQMKKIRVGVVGVGYLGQFHAEKYANMPDVELVGVVDTDKERAEKVAGQVRSHSYCDFREIIGHVDAVSIAVPTPGHFAIGKQLLENDVDVLIEKPITTTLQEADELIRISKARNRYIQVGHLERFNPAVSALEGLVNDPRFIESHRLSIFKDRGTDVSVVLDLMIHDIDIILNLVASEISSIRAAGIPVITEHVDIANARLEFLNGCVANVTASRISTKNERKIRLFQRDKYISVDFANQDITVIAKDGKRPGKVIPGMRIDRLNFAKGDALEEELKSFIQSVSHRSPPLIDGQEGREALRIALEIMEQIHITSYAHLD